MITYTAVLVKLSGTGSRTDTMVAGSEAPI